MKQLLLLEFNELSPILMDEFIGQGHLPNFKRLRDCSTVYKTQTSDEELQPWVQWTTFHLGVPQTDHGIFSLDEGHLVEGAPIWDELCDKGHEALVFGAMNGNSNRPGVDLLPDSWASKVDASNDFLSRIHEFSSHSVQEHTNPRRGLTPKDLASYMFFFSRNGLRVKTLAKLATQVLTEKASKTDVSWRRACLFDLILWDVFLRQWQTSNKPVGVFFGNSTAYLQHRFWRHMDSDSFAVKPTAEQTESYSGAIQSGYQNMDMMVGQILDSVDLADTTIVLATALSQEANPTRRETKPHEAYRPHDFKTFLDWAGVTDVVSVEPLMTHLAWATFSSEESAKRALETLQNVRAKSSSVLNLELHGNRVKFWSSIVDLESPELTLVNHIGNEAKFTDLFALVGSSILDGSHHPDGILWVSSSREIKSSSDTVQDLPLEDAKQVLLASV